MMMCCIAARAPVANVAVAAMLCALRYGDAKLRVVWSCSRNDAVGNLAVTLVAIGVSGVGSGWPESVTALTMGAQRHMSGYQALALETVTTRAGTFYNAMHIREQRGPDYVRDVWYAPGVGMVRWMDGVAGGVCDGRPQLARSMDAGFVQRHSGLHARDVGRSKAMATRPWRCVRLSDVLIRGILPSRPGHLRAFNR